MARLPICGPCRLKLREGVTARGEPSGLSDALLEPPDYDVAIKRVEFEKIAASLSLLRRNQRGPAAAERIEDDPTPLGTVLDRIHHERDRLHRRMHRQLLLAAGPERIYPGIAPEVRAVASGLAEAEIIDMRRLAILKGKDQFVLAAIERAHTSVVLGPHAYILELGIGIMTGREQLSHMAPIHAYEVNGAIGRGAGEVAQHGPQECRELGLGHLDRSHDELPMLHPARPGDVAPDGDIVGRIGEDHLRL